MTWQEDLRELDEEFSSGNLSVAQYRERRERVLTSAAAEPAQEQQPTGDEPTKIIRPVAAPHAQESAEQTEAPAEATQVFRPAEPAQAEPDDAERTEATEADVTQTQVESGEKTQVVAPVETPLQPPAPAPWQQGPPSGGFPVQGPPSGGFPAQGPPSGGFPVQSPPPWGTAEQTEQDAPLWGDELPPPVPPSDDWTSAGSEAERAPGRAGKIVGGVIGLLVLVGLVLGAWWLWFSGPTEPGQPQAVPAPTAAEKPSTSQAPPPPADFGPLVIPDGEGGGPRSYSASELQQSKPLPANDLLLLKKTDVTQARSVIVRQGSTAITLWSFDVGEPRKLFKAMVSDQSRFGFSKVAGSAPDVPVVKSTQQNAGTKVQVYRAHYVNGSTVIRVEAFDVDAKTAKKVFDKVLSDQLDHTPAE